MIYIRSNGCDLCGETREEHIDHFIVAENPAHPTVETLCRNQLICGMRQQHNWNARSIDALYPSQRLP